MLYTSVPIVNFLIVQAKYGTNGLCDNSNLCENRELKDSGFHGYLSGFGSLAHMFC